MKAFKTTAQGIVVTGLLLLASCGGSGSSSAGGGNPPPPPPGSAARLNGHYAFLFTGYDANGPLAIAGSFVADGNGNLTSVVEDVNRGSGVIQNFTFTSTYLVHPNNRGSLFLNSSVIYRFALDTPGNGRFIEFDSTSSRGSGFFVKQDPSAFSLTSFHGSFALGLTGQLAGGHIGTIGRFDSDSAGNLSNGVMDVGVKGSNFGSLALGGSLGAIDANGRGTGTLSVPGAPFAASLKFTFYVLSASQALFLELDSRSSTFPVLSGPAIAQTGSPFSNASLSNPGVFGVTGIDAAGGAAATETTLGRMIPDGAGNLSGVLDQNDGGNIASNRSFNGTYSVTSNGRGTVSFAAGLSSGQVFTFYLTGPNTGVFLEGTAAAPSQNVATGWLQTQTGSSFSKATIAGTFAFGTAIPATAAVHDTYGIIIFDGSGSLGTGSIQDETTPAEFPDERLSGTYSVSVSGRGTLTLTAPSNASSVLYVISSSQFIAIPPFTNVTPSPGLMMAGR